MEPVLVSPQIDETVLSDKLMTLETQAEITDMPTPPEEGTAGGGDASNTYDDVDKEKPASATPNAGAPRGLDEGKDSLDEEPATESLADSKNNRKDSEKAESQAPEAAPEIDYWEERLKNLPKIPAVKEMNFEHFKNRYGEDDGRHIIEVLKAGQNTLDEVNEERLRRKGRGKRNSKAKGNIGSSSTWIQRVRIQSEPVLCYFQNVAKVDGWDTERPRTFFRPFKAFIHFQPKMRDALRILEERWGEAENLDSLGLKEKAAAAIEQVEKRLNDRRLDNDDDDDESDVQEDDIRFRGPKMNSITALRHMRCYVEFIDNKIMPLYDLFKGTSQRKIQFSDLWLLFRIGEIVYSSPVSDSAELQASKRSSHTRMNQAAWKLYRISDTLIHEDSPDDLENDASILLLGGYYIDYDGDSYGPIKHEFQINFFKGEKDITSLELYPIRFVKESQQIRDRLRTQGGTFQSFVKENHLYYEGWTITSSPTGELYKDLNNPEHIESNVIIDFIEGFKHNPSWRPQFKAPFLYDYEWPAGDDNFSIKHWSDIKRTKLLREIIEKTQCGDGTNSQRINENTEKDKFITAYKAGKATQLGENDLILLPRRLVAYALRERKFVIVDILSLRAIVAQSKIFKDLKINPEHKRMVKSLVQAHFRKREIQKKQSIVGLNQDLIRGKGSGLFILLHGVPGVGKTATAEAVAQANKKPLFNITCSDLGFTAKYVENSLNDIFRLAHLWDCVLLLDEADIFLSRRETSDLKRNGLVSVFLRVLEYYSGILFLTTNRVGTLDEAFKSRMHVSLYYEPLKRNQTLDIFKVNIDKLRAIEKEKKDQTKDTDLKESALEIKEESIINYAAWYYDNMRKTARWNGRQIRNAFQVASSLAYYSLRKNSLEDSDEEEATPLGQVKDGETHGSAPILDWRQFDVVAEAIERFEMYLQEATGATDLDAARVGQLRADNFEYRSSPRRPRYQPPTPTQGESAVIKTSQVSTYRRSPGRGTPKRQGRGQGWGQPHSGEQARPSNRGRYPGNSASSRGGRMGPLSGPQAQSRCYQPPPDSTPSRRPLRPRMSSGHSGWSNEDDVEWEQSHSRGDMEEMDEEENGDYYANEEECADDYNEDF
ncbi:MAG: hypothetical protein M1834_003630 [Cirrosporium novae-zelandiae]|nr:MAG: hypothetical protein M1834_003630 [Cirrosporium novae-zelandiae]